MRKLRFLYAAIFAVLLLAEILIGLFVHDQFVRPYIGDVLVTILICCFVRTVVPRGIRALPVYVFVFAALVETAQYFQIVKLLSLEDHILLSTIVGTTFSVADLVCYAAGCIVFWGMEAGVKAILKQ